MNRLITKSIYLLLVITLFGCANAQNEGKEVKELMLDQMQWNQEFFTTDNNRVKGAVTIDTKGTLLLVGQKFTTTDSMQYPSMVAKISPEGDLLMSKPFGNNKMPIANYKRRERYFERNDERLTQVLMTNDSRIILIGYKTLENHEERLWIVEIDENLNILRDSTYMNLPTSDVQKIKAYSTYNGWYVVTGSYWEVNGLSRYGVPFYEFDKDFNCINSTKSLTSTVGDSTLRITYMRDTDKNGDELLICGYGGITHDQLDEDDIVNIPYAFRFNTETKEVEILQKFPMDYQPLGIKKGNNQYTVLFQIREGKVNHQLTISYDSSWKEIWRDEKQIGAYTSPSLLTFKNNLWHTCGRYRREDGNGYYDIAYDSKGNIVSNQTYAHNGLNQRYAYKPEGSSVAIDFDEIVDEIKINNNEFYRIYIEQGWTVDKFEAE